MNAIEILNLELTAENKNLPVNVYAIRILDSDKNITYDIATNHIGYCPKFLSEREQSNYNDYLSNLESDVINVFFKSSKIRKPKNYSHLLEVMTNERGELYHYSRISN